jgi:hypothetical protein
VHAAVACHCCSGVWAATIVAAATQWDKCGRCGVAALDAADGDTVGGCAMPHCRCVYYCSTVTTVLAGVLMVQCGECVAAVALYVCGVCVSP